MKVTSATVNFSCLNLNSVEDKMRRSLTIYDVFDSNSQIYENYIIRKFYDQKHFLKFLSFIHLFIVFTSIDYNINWNHQYLEYIYYVYIPRPGSLPPTHRICVVECRQLHYYVIGS